MRTYCQQIELTMTRLSLSTPSMTSNPDAQKIPMRAWKHHFRNHGVPSRAMDLMTKSISTILVDERLYLINKPEKKISYWICIACANPKATTMELVQLANQLRMSLVDLIRAADLINHEKVKECATELHVQQHIELQTLYEQIGDESTDLGEFEHSDVYNLSLCTIL